LSGGVTPGTENASSIAMIRMISSRIISFAKGGSLL
jgi:hypothetical protein